MLGKLLLTILLTLNFSATPVNQTGEILGVSTQEEGDKIEMSGPEKINPHNLNLEISAPSAIAIDKKTNQILFAKNIHQSKSIASITKLMTALVFLETNPNLEKIVEITQKDIANAGKKNLIVGEKISLKNLLYLSLINSDNTATLALVNSTNLSPDEFINKMNLKIKKLNLQKTTFADPTGLDENNISTAYEIAQILNEVSKNSIIKKILPISNYSFISRSDIPHYIKNTNLLLNSYLNILLGKTGYTDEAGSVLMLLIKSKKTNKKHIVITLGESDYVNRLIEPSQIAKWIASGNAAIANN